MLVNAINAMFNAATQQIQDLVTSGVSFSSPSQTVARNIATANGLAYYQGSGDVFYKQ